MSDILDMCTRSVSAVSLWFINIMTVTGGANLLLGALFIYLSVRFLISPILAKSLGSDQAKKSNSKDKEA